MVNYKLKYKYYKYLYLQLAGTAAHAAAVAAAHAAAVAAAAADANKITVKILLVDGSILNFNLKLSNTIKDVKEQIFKTDGTPLINQTLFFKDDELNDDDDELYDDDELNDAVILYTLPQPEEPNTDLEFVLIKGWTDKAILLDLLDKNPGHSLDLLDKNHGHPWQIYLYSSDEESYEEDAYDEEYPINLFTDRFDVRINRFNRIYYFTLDEDIKIRNIPDSFTYLSYLEELHISNNKLTRIPESIGYLKKLTNLDLSYNQLTDIPDSIGNLTNLTQLYLSYNQLTDIPDSIVDLKKLTDLNLCHNQLTDIPDSIGDLTNLTDLNLSYNQLTDIPDSIGDLTNLTDLNLSYNQLTDIPDNIEKLTNLTRCDTVGNYELSQDKTDHIKELVLVNLQNRDPKG